MRSFFDTNFLVICLTMTLLTRKSRRWQFSSWDALIIEAALSSGAALLFSEDLQHGQVIEKMNIQNPFL